MNLMSFSSMIIKQLLCSPILTYTCVNALYIIVWNKERWKDWRLLSPFLFFFFFFSHIIPYFVVFKVLLYRTGYFWTFSDSNLSISSCTLTNLPSHPPLKPPYWKLCLRRTKFDSFWEASIGSLLCHYVEGVLHLFLLSIFEIMTDWMT